MSKEDTQQQIGKVLTSAAHRDAIHIAVAPVKARHFLVPAQNIGLDENGMATCSPGAGKYIGLVDPFLPNAVSAGETFYMFLYPNTITGLRHEWSHPSFADGPQVIGDKAASIAWMRKWAVEHMGYDYYGDEDQRSEESAYASAIDAGHSASVGPYESARDYIDAEWWQHWQTITGSKKEQPDYFSCGC